MIVQFAKWGNSLALRIPQPFAREIAAEDGTRADLKIEGGSLVVTPVDHTQAVELDQLLSEITPENLHGEISEGGAVGNEFA
jgi:antitoxin MazE